jgi:DNA methylase/ParB-like nuclease domain
MIVDDLATLATPLDELRPLPGNPRRGDVEAIARSLAAFGQRKPIVANRTTGEVIAGNHTLLAARSLSWSEVAVVWVTDDQATAHAYALADNRTAELGTYDDEALATLLAEVYEADEELFAATGWTDDDLTDLLDQLETPSAPAVAPRSWSDASGAGVLRGDALALPLRASSVDLVVSSPPYFALRSYQDEGGHYAGQLGSEPTPGDFLAALWAVLDECWRVLKPSGSAWINLGDKYAGGDKAGVSHNGTGASTLTGAGGRTLLALHEDDTAAPERDVAYDVADKSLVGLPWRFALGLICPEQYRPGGGPTWTLRAEVVWHKPNGLPESVTDRVRRSHEQWFHFVKDGRYFAAVDEVREESQERIPEHQVYANKGELRSTVGGRAAGMTANGWRPHHHNPLGKLPGSVWSIPSQPLTVPDDLGVDHFAAFPAEWPRRIIDGWSPTGICTACGEPRRPAVDKALRVKGETTGRTKVSDVGDYSNDYGWNGEGYPIGTHDTTITGYRCACDIPSAPTSPAVVLDPFGGTGTVAMMARAMGRYGVHVDLSRDYNRLACWRIFDSDGGQRCLDRAEDATEPRP